jgi:hypothetical protein
MGGAMQQAGGAMAGAFGGLQSAAAGGGVKTRNALMTFLLPILIIVGGQVLGIVLASIISPFLAMIGSLIALVGVVLMLVFSISMLLELKNFTRNEAFNWWFIFIPCLNIYFMWFLVPQEVARAKQMAGSPAPPRGIVVYIFLFLYALAADLNDVANPHGQPM